MRLPTLWRPTDRARRTASMFALAVGLVALGVLIGYALRPDSGAHVLARDAEEWSALATALAVIVALWFGLRDDRARSEELTRLVDERDEARRSRQNDRAAAEQELLEQHVRDVVIWATRTVVHNGEKWVEILTVGFTNASPWPISEALVILKYPNGTTEVGAIAMVVEAGGSSPAFSFYGDQPKDLPGAEGVSLEFADRSGVMWSRRAKGTHRRISTISAPREGRGYPGHAFKFIGRQTNEPWISPDPTLKSRTSPGSATQ